MTLLVPVLLKIRALYWLISFEPLPRLKTVGLRSPRIFVSDEQLVV
ncbi:MAG: hypothetical protein KI793_18920 [Rivularia sp. (in: Bacteria)]|nr:hypothetical protein [Rivularia sp. MS3]